MNVDSHMILAMYLPQYHEICENNEWWGTGYTDWVAVKKARRELSFQNQPRVPFSSNYYDLSNPDTLRWQNSLMKKYMVDGMCFYHYYFANGKKILERPAEILLENKDIEMPFCFCWANESWVSSWSNISGENVWSYKYEKKEKMQRFLMKQEYGCAVDWTKHFEYLLPFFKDTRYICINGRPVVFIYKTDIIECLNEMRVVWDNLAIENGFKGVYIVGGNSKYDELDFVDAFYIHEPLTTKNSCPIAKKKNEPAIVDYDDIWRLLLSRNPKLKQTIFGGFVGYDDTPRHGNMGTVIFGQTVNKFKEYLSELIAKNIVGNSPFTIINAWNEWGEGMYLEPDELDAFGYLETIRYAKNNYKRYMDKYTLRWGYTFSSPDRRMELISAKNEAYWKVLDLWMTNKENGLQIYEYLYSNGIKSICIYGYGKIGRHLKKDLIGSKVMVEAIMDNGIKEDEQGNIILKKGDIIPNVNAIIVALSFGADSIKDELDSIYNNVKIFSIYEILSDMQN